MNQELENIKQKLLKNSNFLNKELLNRILSINNDKHKPLGKFNFSYIGLEITRGCNLRCGFCATRLFPVGVYQFMSVETFTKLMQLVQILTPYNRIEIANAGEPTLNPNLCKCLKIGRKISPYTCFQVITNGTLLIKKEISYRDLFENGANIIYVDMYAPKEKHIELAKKSGYHWYLRSEKKETDPAAWTYHKDPNLKCIILQEQPGEWSENKIRFGYLSTFMNNLDWNAAKEYNLYPIQNAPNRRCNQPFRTVNIGFDGTYSFCCFDFMRNIYGKIGNVNEGIEGFFKFWLGNYMQYTRNLLHYKDRNSHHLCKKCSFTSSRGDIPCWDDNSMNHYWDGNNWQSLNIKHKESPLSKFLK